MDKRSKKKNSNLKKSLNNKKSKNSLILKLKYEKSKGEFKDYNSRKYIFTYIPNNNVFIY
jgi:hypothetical protein